METNELIEWLHEHASKLSHDGDYHSANMILLVAGYIKGVAHRALIAEVQRDRAREKLARITGEKEYERISQD